MPEKTWDFYLRLIEIIENIPYETRKHLSISIFSLWVILFILGLIPFLLSFFIKFWTENYEYPNFILYSLLIFLIGLIFLILKDNAAKKEDEWGRNEEKKIDDSIARRIEKNGNNEISNGQQLLRDIIVKQMKPKKNTILTRQEILEHSLHIFQKNYPEGRYLEQSISRKLQLLRDQEYLTFEGNWIYKRCGKQGMPK